MENGEKSFKKLFDIIELIASRREARPVHDIAAALKMPESTVYRMLRFLARRGYVERTPSGFMLGKECLFLGETAQEQNLLPRLARPVLSRLADATSETVHLARMQGNHIVYIDKIDGGRSIRMGSVIGSVSPLHCTGIGKAMLAALPDDELAERLPTLELERFTETTICSLTALKRELEAIRRRGCSFDDSEHELGVFCVGAAVPDRSGRCVAGISVAGSSIRLKPEAATVAKLVCAAAREISAKL